MIRTERVALLIHDLQAYFLEPFDRWTAPLAPALKNIIGLRTLCNRLEIPVFFSAQPGEQERSERGLLWDLWGPGIIGRPELSRFADGFTPHEHERIIPKHRYSAFFDTTLHDELRSLGRDQLIVTGIFGHIGCQATCLDGFMRGIETFLIADALADFSLEDHLVALRQVARTCGVVSSTDDVVFTLAQAHVLENVRCLLEEHIDMGLDDELAELGLDSIRHMMLIERVLLPEPQPEFEALIEATSVRRVASLLAAQIETRSATS